MNSSCASNPGSLRKHANAKLYYIGSCMSHNTFRVALIVEEALALYAIDECESGKIHISSEIKYLNLKIMYRLT